MKKPLKVLLMLSAFGFGAAYAQTKPAPAKPAAGKNGNIEQGIDKMFAALDKDNNKQLSYDEFKNGVVAERRQAMLMQRLGQIFQDADKNGNKTLEVVEFNALPGVKAAKDPKPKFADYDKNKDQKMDFREYLEVVSKMSEQAPKK
ncbi:MAG: EF-hand domain-containing protein [Arenimonas sp.]